MLKSKKPRESIPIAIFSLQLSFFQKLEKKQYLFHKISRTAIHLIIIYKEHRQHKDLYGRSRKTCIFSTFSR